MFRKLTNKKLQIMVKKEQLTLKIKLTQAITKVLKEHKSVLTKKIEKAIKKSIKQIVKKTEKKIDKVIKQA